jgi:hypothetical protein
MPTSLRHRENNLHTDYHYRKRDTSDNAISLEQDTRKKTEASPTL